MLAGFGNLQGQMEVWDVKKYKQVRSKGQGSVYLTMTFMQKVSSMTPLETIL